MSGLKSSILRWLRPRTKIGQIILTGLTLGVIILFGFRLFRNFSDQPENIKDENTISVEARIIDHGIQFSSESIQSAAAGESYFVNYRLEREQTRQETQSMLSALLGSSDSKTRQEAEQKWLDLSNKISAENEVENLLKIKGFEDAVANYNSGKVNVIVFASKLSTEEVDLIQKIVQQSTDVDEENVIVSMKR